MRILLWHVHGSWTTAFVRGGHEYLIPVQPGRLPGADLPTVYLEHNAPPAGVAARARAHALARYGLGRFLADWDRLLNPVVTDG